ncbi:hypothetical protein L1S32_00485 [Methanogenium sp. S4BF]|uniref:hypothetical protein n=1 Tax=Methanogenium sp. S4BF TaxID=1789226 RepID=UPI002417737C|nr:hypothetical protein [Methanogenium sp. S4BF]WFN34633.1 hypothetical protein L1S32_00485 [Methanogenium sp. S4BF]
MASFAEGDEILRPVIGRIAVPVMDVEIFFSTAEPAPVPIPSQNDFPELFPFFQTVFIPYGDGHGMTVAEENTPAALSIGTGIAKAPVCIFSGHVPAGWVTSGMK